jgi:antitoxin component YwqK of YwqJK toxin-antitoxin module
MRQASILIACTVFLCLSALAQDDGGPAAKRQIIIAKIEDLPADLKNAPHVVPRLQSLQRKKEFGDGTRYRLTIDKFFDSGHGHSTEKFEPFVSSLVPVDEQDRPHGTERFFQLRGHGADRVVNWKHGVRHGPELVYDRSPIKEVGTYVRTETPWENGKIHGNKIVRGTNGKISSECTFVNGLQQGIAKSYGPDGSVVSEIPYKDGEKNGEAVYYHAGTDQVKRKVTYKDDLINGTTVEYYPNGKIKRRMQIKDSRMHGVIEMFDEDGNLAKKMYCLNGETVTEAEFKREYKP